MRTVRLINLFLMQVIVIFTMNSIHADQDNLTLFPMQHYNQTISHWISPTSSHYNNALIKNNVRKKHMQIFYEHYFGSFSPWNPNHITQILRLKKPDDLKTIELELIKNFDNEGKPLNQIGYGENFSAHTKAWIDSIKNNVNLAQFDQGIYEINNRGIAVDNLHARALPTDDVYFYSNKIAGEGYPFDNLQISALWIGTPVYILGETRDHAWMLVDTPEYIGWVKSSGIARADKNFVSIWTQSAKNKLAAITKTQTSLVDDKGNFLSSAYVGTVLPGFENLKLMVPVANLERFAVIKFVNVSNDDAVIMPLLATPHHFADIMQSLIGRPYGWGSVYFYNDCSQELKSLLTPFGIWLPRNSSEQITIGKMIDMSSFPIEKRLSYLIENGHPFLTLIYVGGHIIMYVGNYRIPFDSHALSPLTYENMWGLSPNPPIRRSVVGKSVFFPLLIQYPEDTSLISQAGKTYFKINFLDELADEQYLKQKILDLRSLMYP